MKITIEIKDSKARAFLNFIKSLDFISIQSTRDDKPEDLSTEQKKAIDKAIKELDMGKSLSHKEVMKATRKKYPHLF